MSQFGEPWQCNLSDVKRGTDIRIRDAEGRIVGEFRSSIHYDFTNEMAAARAKRLVDCVNACQFLSDDELHRVADGKAFVTLWNCDVTMPFTTINPPT